MEDFHREGREAAGDGDGDHADDEREADETKAHKFLILAVNCAHLGCPVEWFQESGLFMCPCHGGVYYANGERASGPPPRASNNVANHVESQNGPVFHHLRTSAACVIASPQCE